MKKTSFLALSLIGPFAFLAPVYAAPNAAAEPAKAEVKRDLAKIFDGKLVDAEGKSVKTDSLKKAKYVAVYFSAHWCGPCRKFTPTLVKFAEEHAKDDKVQVVFVSADHSKKDMLGYMAEAKMPWGGVLEKGASLQGVNDGVTGIPHLRVFDADGKVAIETDYKKGMGPTKVLEELKSKLK